MYVHSERDEQITKGAQMKERVIHSYRAMGSGEREEISREVAVGTFLAYHFILRTRRTATDFSCSRIFVGSGFLEDEVLVCQV